MSLNCSVLPKAVEGRVHVAGVGGLRRWARTARWRRILAITGLRRTLIRPISVKIAFRPSIMRFYLSKSSQMCISNPSKSVYLEHLPKIG